MARKAKTSREAGGKAIAAIVLAMAAVEAMIGTGLPYSRTTTASEKSTLNPWRRKRL